MKEKAIVIDDGDSIMDGYDDGGKRSIVNANSENTSLMSEKIDIPIICLDEEEDDDDIMIDKDYKVVFDNLCRDDNGLSPSVEVDNGESDTRKICPCVSKIPKLVNENLMKKKVSQQGHKRRAIGFKADVKRSKIREDIQRDNRIAERRKRRLAFSETEKTSRTVPFIKTQQDIQRDNKVKEVAELKVEASEAVPLLRTQKDCQRDKKVSKLSDLKAGALRTQEDSQRDKTISEVRKRQDDELKPQALRAIPLDRTQRGSERNNTFSKGRKSQADELKAHDLRAVPLFGTQENSQRHNTVLEGGKRQTDELKAEVLRDKTQEDSQLDETISEGRKRQADELKPQALRVIPLVRTQQGSEQDNTFSKWRKSQADVLKAPDLRAVPLFGTQENSQRHNRVLEGGKRQSDELKAEVLRDGAQEASKRDKTISEGRKRQADELKPQALRDVPLVTTQEDSQRDTTISIRRKRQADELNAETLRRAVPVVRTQQGSERDNTFSKGKKRQADELKAQTLRAIPLIRTQEQIEEDTHRDNGIAEQRKRKLSEAKATKTSRLVHVERGNRCSEVKDVGETSRKKGVFAGRRNKNEKRSVMVVDNQYMIYLTWLVDSLKDSLTEPMENLENDDSDPPILDTYKESTKVPETDVLVKPKVEQDVEYMSDDSDIIEISDTPFLDGEDTPFVASKKVVDLDDGSKEDESNSNWFRKELMDVLKQPYDEGELNNLRHEVSIHRRMIRCRELRKGRETDYETNELGQSYLDRFPDFDEEYKMVDGVDKVKALKLLRGFFFYLKYVSHDGAFKPWGKTQ